MKTSLTNRTNIRLPLAVWLASDEYDHDPRPNAVSATTLMKPVKSVVLGVALKQMEGEAELDISDLIPSRLGSAFHDGIENSWLSPELGNVLAKLGYPRKVIEKIQINPPRPGFNEDDHNIWMEQRAEMKFGNWIVTGKFDIVFEYGVEDYKSTKTFNWIHGGNDEKYMIQGSIYRLLNQDIVRQDTMKVNFLFTDWTPLKAISDKEYPQRAVETRKLELMSIEDTQEFIRGKLSRIESYLGKQEKDIPACTPEEVWQKPTKWAYFKNPKNQRATKVFEDEGEASRRFADDGAVGRIDVRPGEVKYCRYCPARPICKQAENYQQAGLLKI